MDQQRVKMVVGMMLYKHGYRGVQGSSFVITKIEGDVARHADGVFCYGVGADGYATIRSYWEIEYPAPKTPKSRECKCGIFRGDCIYHRDEI